MSSIEELVIKGIRSFSPDGRGSKIRFYTPLTLIVGHNGAGKTTVIECLKYATTGDLPPNSKSGAFIHDPKIAKEVEVKAQVKLLFRSVDGKVMDMTRSLSLTQKKATVSMKTLENILHMVNEHGEVNGLAVASRWNSADPEISISNRCADMDAEMPDRLGVSKAILENVIFCHQEDSFWQVDDFAAALSSQPLSEPSVLKKKFDAIFAATRYTKAIENIKALRKDQAVDLKLDRQRLQHLGDNRDKANKTRVLLSGIQTNIRIAKERYDRIEGSEINVLLQQLKDYAAQDSRTEQLRLEIQTFAKEHEMVVASMEGMKGTFEEYAESDEELQALLRTYSERITNEKQDLEDKERQKASATAELSHLQQDMSLKLTTQGQLQAEQSAFQRRMKERDHLAQELAAQSCFKGIEGLDSASTPQFIQRTREALETQERALKDLETDGRAKEEALRSAIHDHRTAWSIKIERKNLTHKQLEASRSKLDTASSRLRAVSGSGRGAEEIAAALAKEESMLSAAGHSDQIQDLEQAIVKQSRELAAEEARLHQFADELTMLNMQSDTRARLGIKKSEHKRKSDALEKMFKQLSGEYQRQLGTPADPSSMEQSVLAMIATTEKAIKEMEQQEQEEQKRMTACQTKLGIMKGSYEKSKGELRDKVAQLKQACGESDYATAMEKAEIEYQDYLEVSSSMTSAAKFYEQFLAVFESKKHCPLCVRQFGTREEEKKFTSRLKAVIQAVPGQVKDAQEELASLEKHRTQLLNLRGVADEVEKLKKSVIPELRKSIGECEEELEACRSDHDDVLGNLGLLGVEHDQLILLKTKIGEHTRLKSELAALGQEVDRLSKDLEAGGSGKTMDELQQEQEECSSRCMCPSASCRVIREPPALMRISATCSKQLRKSLEQANGDIRAKQREIQSKEVHIRNLRERLNAEQLKDAEKAQLIKTMDELQKETSAFNREIENAEREISSSSLQIRAAEKELSSFRSDLEAKKSVLVKDLAQLRDAVNQIQAIERDIQRYVNSRGDERLQRCIKEVRAVETQKRNIETQIAGLSNEIESVLKVNSQIQVLQRGIDDNLRYRQMERKIEQISRSLDTAKAELQRQQGAEFAADYARVKKKHDQLISERATLLGELKQLEEQERHLLEQLDSDYKNIDEEFHEGTIKLKTEELAYYDLENAIMKYHSMKMEEINKTIRELWTNTYQGADIDTIEIRSDNEGIRGNQSYNYRVVMIKSDIELDMRGRCSAGQKVLASLIIRLALAESFCLNCGILALDEPTTNLDRANIESLAESLVNIIKMRRLQSNFQLIIITHDEEFMQLLGKSEFCDHYWRVLKNSEYHNVLLMDGSFGDLPICLGYSHLFLPSPRCLLGCVIDRNIDFASVLQSGGPFLRSGCSEIHRQSIVSEF
ncbi:uncharacterized protein BJ171DRAFT_477830 [Polychytrium aggregatum]|uniref:uncharacterized protein n=1 Tax=Polychytrium aggregatum TaxID=110093 RepID=UPI0022FDC8F2|nr:uncharacterized protein BJ171DRAFT_477830 [Polychytrium aggregatum]KAI9197472.1 hypothetical protein BJ171DRAFT_477830 [Polychytrium aggregatum]